MGIMKNNYVNLMKNKDYAEIVNDRLDYGTIFQAGLKSACEICDEMTECFKKGESFAECISKLTALDKEKNRTEDYRIVFFNQQFALALGKEMFKDKFDLEKYNEVMLDSLNEDGLGMHTVSTGDEIPAHLLETFQMPELASEVKNFEPVLFGLQESLKTINHYKKEAAEFSKERSQLDDEYYRLQVMYEKNKKKLNERYLESMKKKLEELGQNGNNNEKN